MTVAGIDFKTLQTCYLCRFLLRVELWKTTDASCQCCACFRACTSTDRSADVKPSSSVMELDGSLFNDDLFSVDLENIAIPSLPLHFQFPDTDLADEADKSGRLFSV